MELTDDFAGTGKAYLMGLAVTDEPASLGTSQLHFSRKEQCPVFISQPTDALSFASYSDAESEKSKPCEDSFLEWFKRL